MTSPELVDRLEQLGTLGAAPRAELEWLVAHGTLRVLEEGDIVTAKGVQVEGMFILLSGHVGIFVDQGAGLKKVMEWKTGDVTGMLPYSRMVAPPGDNLALARTEVLAVPRGCIRSMITECHELTSFLVHKMIERARLFASSAQHDEKLVSLGKLSAGLAHELNNPAAAIERSAALLDDRLDVAERATLALGAARLSPEQLTAIECVREACLAKPLQGVLSPIQQAEREDAITDWLDDRGLDPGIASQLSETSVTIQALEQIAASVEGPSLEAVLQWAAAGCSVRGLATEIQDAAMRISGLVSAVKGFTHMDQGGAAEAVDLTQSLSNTVSVLKSKARSKSVAVTLEFEPDLPRATGFVGELNQIWANLIDNALDAVPQGGHVAVSARRERQFVVVRVVDDGPGIPPDVKERMFDPFFTTKGVGKGTGLGLDIVRRLLGHNNALIEVDSTPGCTEFKVSLPLTDGHTGGVRS